MVLPLSYVSTINFTDEENQSYSNKIGSTIADNKNVELDIADSSIKKTYLMVIGYEKV